jgi:hypothetical protein
MVSPGPDVQQGVTFRLQIKILVIWKFKYNQKNTRRISKVKIPQGNEQITL